jgi:aldose 1-epimerase
MLRISAEQMLCVGESLIPTGAFADVAHTPFDFTHDKQIGAGVNANDAMLHIAGGYDHCFVLNNQNAATLRCPATRRVLELYTTLPGLHVYSGHGSGDTKRTAVALEAQHFPDSPNHANFPSCVLRPGQQYDHTISFKLATE